jgi:hypothetical protein
MTHQTLADGALLIDQRPARPRVLIGRTAHLITAKAVYAKALIRGYSPSTGRMTLEAYLSGARPGRTIATINTGDLQPFRSRTVDDIPPAPLMTVFVLNRGCTRSYEGVWTTEVTIVKTCPVCGGPRGDAYGSHFREDGEYYHCHTWDNPCGHNDMYSSVLVEAGVHPPFEERP